MRHRVILVFTLLLMMPALVKAASSSVPSWFVSNPSDPYAIFSAWRNLSTRDAALFLSGSWTVLGGQLVDEQGRPQGLTQMSFICDVRPSGYGGELVTDKDGFFLIYGRLSLDPSEPADDNREYGTCEFFAAPGYPAGFFGANYALSKKEIKSPSARLLLKEPDRAFYVLTVDGHNSFEKEGFETYRLKTAEELGTSNTAPVRPRRFSDNPRPREGSTENRKRTAYKLRVVATNGNPIPHAIVKYQAYDGYEGNYQVVETDDKGLCEVVEYLLIDKEKVYYSEVSRQITVDTPTVVGPMSSVSLKQNVVNTITLDNPASVSGRLTNHRGDPVRTRLSVSYKRANLIAFELDIPVLPDGTFSCDRIMPGEEFRLVAGGALRQTTPRAPVASDYISLSSGEARIVNLVAPLASALLILVVDQQGRPLDSESTLKLADGSETSGGSQSAGKFAFSPLGATAFTIQVKARGFEDYSSDPIQLEPGELRFVRIVLTPKVATVK